MEYELDLENDMAYRLNDSGGVVSKLSGHDFLNLMKQNGGTLYRKGRNGQATGAILTNPGNNDIFRALTTPRQAVEGDSIVTGTVEPSRSRTGSATSNVSASSSGSKSKSKSTAKKLSPIEQKKAEIKAERIYAKRAKEAGKSGKKYKKKAEQRIKKSQKELKLLEKAEKAAAKQAKKATTKEKPNPLKVKFEQK